MGKNRAERIVVHLVPAPDGAALADKVDELYVGYIERRLREAGLSPAQKLAVLDGMLEMLRAIEPSSLPRPRGDVIVNQPADWSPPG